MGILHPLGICRLILPRDRDLPPTLLPHDRLPELRFISRSLATRHSRRSHRPIQHTHPNQHTMPRLRTRHLDTRKRKHRRDHHIFRCIRLCQRKQYKPCTSLCWRTMSSTKLRPILYYCLHDCQFRVSSTMIGPLLPKVENEANFNLVL